MSNETRASQASQGGRTCPVGARDGLPKEKGVDCAHPSPLKLRKQTTRHAKRQRGGTMLRSDATTQTQSQQRESVLTSRDARTEGTRHPTLRARHRHRTPL